MKNKYRILKILVVLVLFAFLLSFSLKRFSQKDQKIQIAFVQNTPVYFVDEAMVQTMADKVNPSKKVGEINIPVLERDLDKIPAVDSANVYLNLNGVLNIDVKQRVPMLRINTGTKEFYVDEKSNEFPLSENYSHPCWLVSGKVPKKDYPALIELAEKLNKDSFEKKFFVGINRNQNGDYELLTHEGIFKVELGDLNNLDFKLKGFKTFAEKYLIHEDLNKYKKISVKYDNQVVTTLRRGYKPYEYNLEKENKE